MNGPNLMQFAMNMLKQNPNVARNPQAQAMLQVLQSGDAQKGQQIAQNLCQTYGLPGPESLGFYPVWLLRVQQQLLQLRLI